MNLYEQIISIYPELAGEERSFLDGTIILQDDSNGKGPYIKAWNHPSLPEPTIEQLVTSLS